MFQLQSVHEFNWQLQTFCTLFSRLDMEFIIIWSISLQATTQH